MIRQLAWHARPARPALASALVCLAPACFLAAPAAALPARSEQLVAANFSHRQDSMGFPWDVQAQGHIGDGLSDCFDNAQVLAVNGVGFQCRRPLMTADGREFVLTAPVRNSLEVTRRIKVDAKACATRYVEVIRNVGTAPARAVVTLTTHLGSNCQSVLSDSGAANPTALGAGEGGVVAVQHPGGGRPSVLFHLAGPKSAKRPAVSVSGRRRFVFTYALTVPPGKTVSILHALAQRRIAAAPDARTLASMFRAFRSRGFTRDLPAGLRRTIVNGARGLGFGNRAGPLAALEALGVPRGGMDVLVFRDALAGEETILTGVASCACLSVETPHGGKTVPFEKVAGLSGGRSGGKMVPGTVSRTGPKGASHKRSPAPFSPHRVFLRDGQVFAGRVEAPGLKFTMSSGLTVRLSMETLDRLVTRQLPEDGEAGERSRGWVETVSGERLALKALSGPAGVKVSRTGRTDGAAASPAVTTVTPWGRRRVRLEELRSLRAVRDGVGYGVELKDGSRFFAYLACEGDGVAVRLETLAFGPRELRASELVAIEARSVDSSSALRRAKAVPGSAAGGAAVSNSQRFSAGRTAGGIAGDMAGDSSRPHVILSGENLLVGAIDLAEVGLVTGGELISIPPQQIRLMHNMSAEGGSCGGEPVFSAELWGGGAVVGRLPVSVLPVRFGEEVWHVSSRDVIDVVVPTPTIPDALRASLARAVRDLGHPDWQRREEATRALAELGYVARRQLEEANATTRDAEVRKRTRELLDGMKEPRMHAHRRP